MAQTRVRQRFEDVGYNVNELWPDYGEDLLVRVFKRENATPYAFLIQSKGSRARTTKPTKKNGTFGYSVRLTSDHLKIWRRLGLPVVVTFWDASRDEIFWAFVPTQTYVWPSRPAKYPRMSLHVPIANKLDARGINRIRVEVVEQHSLLERQAQCISALIDVIHSETPIRDIEVDPRNMFISYSNPRDSRRPITLLFLGSLARISRMIAEQAGAKSPSRYLRSVFNRAAKTRNPAPRSAEPRTDEEIIQLLQQRQRRKARRRRPIR